METHALIDMGSNTIRLSVFGRRDDGTVHQLFSEKEMAGLANYVDDGVMSTQGARRAIDALSNFEQMLTLFGITKVNVFATASLRNIKNTDQIVDLIKEETGYEVEIISGTDEAKLGYYGVLSWMNIESGTVFDIGGGSMEVTEIKSRQIMSAQSVDIGSLVLFKKYVSGIWPDKDEIEDITDAIERKLEGIDGVRSNLVYGIGGTARGVLKLAQSYYKMPIQNRAIYVDQLDEICDFLTSESKEARNFVLKSYPDRIHTIIPGTLIIQTLCRKIHCQTLMISPYGAREGYLYKMLGQKLDG